MKYLLLIAILITGCANEAAEMKEKTVEADSAIDLGKVDLPVPENLETDSAALEQIKAKLDCMECGIKRDDKYENKTSLRYFVDCDTIKYVVTYDPEKKEVLESELVETN
ncbi:hypothetical protein [Gimesia algae]|uniref:Uncharacterized protein n=1 Tax=Gimesia algae TaxID=2527971 RepID=A0A517VBV1_9PLAN|nr:hypothetical protein [Gimesia algae]QDT90492.1 hypothetical protein Pan161_21440 [Gimesia algae]